MRSLLGSFLLLALIAATARAAEPVGDDAMIRQCRGELEERLFSGGAHGESFITAQAVERQSERVLVHLDLASGEGRRVSGTCIFKDGKLFDVK